MLLRKMTTRDGTANRFPSVTTGATARPPRSAATAEMKMNSPPPAAAVLIIHETKPASATRASVRAQSPCGRLFLDVRLRQRRAQGLRQLDGVVVRPEVHVEEPWHVVERMAVK